MKRDMNLVLAIMRDLETNCGGAAAYHPPCENFKCSQEDLEGHFRLIIERGLAEGNRASNGYYFTEITWLGHDFLDNAKTEAIWKKAIKVAGNLSFGVFLRVLEETATQYAMKHIRALYDEPSFAV